MLRNTTQILLFIIAFNGTVFSQIAKGDKFYEKAEYVKAIPYYKKVARSSSDSKQEAYVKLGDSYRLMNDYANAEESYGKAIEQNGPVAPEVYYNYAQILKANNKYTEAAEQYQNYIKLSPNDQNAKNALKFCREIKYYLSMPIEYSVKNIETINTSKSEFSPFVTNNKLMFVAERESFDMVNYNLNEYNGEPYLNMYISNIENLEVQKSKTFSRKLNTDFHDGPACVSADGQTLYFTRVDYKEKKGFVNNAKIFTAVGSDRSWKKIKPIDELNSDTYSVAHPSISSDNKTLFFTSNMPGGYGGKDIWMSRKDTGGIWGKPVNLGPDINTSGDEMFPAIRKDSLLFFSSNGLPGYGGLDIYSAKQMGGKWIVQRNEGLDINSSKDDFGITFLNDTIGYFSSNRTGGKGNDDIYLYRFKSRIMVIDGTVLLTENLKDYAKLKKVYLIDESGNIIDSTFTDNKGFFAFKNLDVDKKYMTAIDDGDPEFQGKARFYLAEKDSMIHRVTMRVGKNKFAFKNLPVDVNALPDLSTEDNLVLAGNLLYGDNKALKNTRIRIISDKGDVMEETTTNEFGAFAFRNIPADQNYLISIEETDISLPEGTKLTLTNKSGKELKSFVSPGITKDKKFTFKILSTDKTTITAMEADDDNMVMDIYGYMYDQDKKPLVNTKIKVSEMDGSNEQHLTTNEKGRFSFKNLSADKNYIFETDESDPSLAGVKRIYIADNKGKIYKIVDMNGGKFSFKILEADKAALGEFKVDDPWLKVAEMKVKEKEKEKAKEKELAKAKEPKTKEPKVKEPKTKEPVAVTEPETKTEPTPTTVPTPTVAPELEIDPTLTIVENIYYAYGSFKIEKEGKTVLNKAVEVLKANPRLIMEISSHTDAQSSSGFNMRLSQKRAQTAVDYLAGKGISRSRLKARGYGETKILNQCTDGVACSDDEHKINRRTEFKMTHRRKK